MSLIAPILEHYGVTVKDVSGWQPIKCPHPNHEDRHASASCRLDIDAVVCFGCDLKTVGSVTLVQKIEGVSRDSAEAKATSILTGSGHSLPESVLGGSRGASIRRSPRDYERGSPPVWARGGKSSGSGPRDVRR